MPVVEEFTLPSKANGADQDRCDRCAGQYAYVGRQLACASCGHPAPDTHPEQIQLKKDWAAHDQRLKKEAEQHQREANEASRSPTHHVGMMSLVEERFASLERLLAAQDKRIATLETDRGRKK